MSTANAVAETADLSFCEECVFRVGTLPNGLLCSRNALEFMREFHDAMKGRAILDLTPGQEGVITSEESRASFEPGMVASVVACIESVSQGGEPISPEE